MQHVRSEAFSLYIGFCFESALFIFCVHFDLASVKNRPDAIVSDGNRRATSCTLLKHAVARLPCTGAICFHDHNPEHDAVLHVSQGRGKCAVWTAKRYGRTKTQKRRNTRAKTEKTHFKSHIDNSESKRSKPRICKHFRKTTTSKQNRKQNKTLQKKMQHYKKQHKQRSLQHLNILETGNNIKENILSFLCLRFYRSQIHPKTIFSRSIFSDWFFTSFAFQ